MNCLYQKYKLKQSEFSGNVPHSVSRFTGQYASWSTTITENTAVQWMMYFFSPLMTLLINNETISKGRGDKPLIQTKFGVLLRGRNSSCLDHYVLLKRVVFLKHECNRCLQRHLSLKGKQGHDNHKEMAESVESHFSVKSFSVDLMRPWGTSLELRGLQLLFSFCIWYSPSQLILTLITQVRMCLTDLLSHSQC